MPLNLKNKKITIIGLKRSGLALIDLVQNVEGIARVSDKDAKEKTDPEVLARLENKKIAYEFGQHTEEFIKDSDLLVLSPGVPFHSQPVLWAKQKNIPVLGEIEFAYQFCDKPVIAVTGSNGKTTVVNLIHRLLQKAGYQSCLCGNVGAPFSKFVLDLQGKDFVVLEVSSFQMESLLSPDSPFRQENSSLSLKGFKPSIAIVLNFSQNHLDRHKNLQEYFEAKTRIFLNQDNNDFSILNFNNAWLRELGQKLSSTVVYFDAPNSQYDPKIINPNHMAVMEVAKILKIDTDVALKLFDEFKGVEHRCELVRTIDGVDFINDSKATTAEATGWALKSLQRPIILICGGRDKNIDFSVLRERVHEKVKKMIVIGEAREKLKKAFQGVVDLEETQSLEEAVLQARKTGRKGDCVLLSPMCASFDMFKDYEHRGKVFKEIVNKL